MFDVFLHLTKQKLTKFSDNIDYICPSIATRFVSGKFGRSGANVITVARNPSQYLYNTANS